MVCSLLIWTCYGHLRFVKLKSFEQFLPTLCMFSEIERLKNCAANFGDLELYKKSYNEAQIAMVQRIVKEIKTSSSCPYTFYY